MTVWQRLTLQTAPFQQTLMSCLFSPTPSPWTRRLSGRLWGNLACPKLDAPRSARSNLRNENVTAYESPLEQVELLKWMHIIKWWRFLMDLCQRRFWIVDFLFEFLKEDFEVRIWVGFFNKMLSCHFTLVCLKLREKGFYFEGFGMSCWL